MRESTRPDAEKVAVTAALLELAAATRDTSIDAGVLRVYMPHLDEFSVADIKAGCESLHTAEWFPKVGELVKAVSRAGWSYDWFESCKRDHNGTCLGQQAHAIKCQLDAAKAARVSA